MYTDEANSISAECAASKPFTDRSRVSASMFFFDTSQHYECIEPLSAGTESGLSNSDRRLSPGNSVGPQPPVRNG